jgi:solute carrier family 25 oxoglutarate transporter 11
MQPIEMIKVQIQAYSEQIGRSRQVSSLRLIKNMLANGHGVKQFYRGLDAAFLHQMTYTATRMGIYRSMFHTYQKRHEHVPFKLKISFAMFSGFLGGFIGAPADLVMVRQQLDSTLPLGERRRYRHVFEAFRRIMSEEGIFKLWRGSNIVILRATLLNTCLLGPFDEIKERMVKYYGPENVNYSRLFASAFASFFVSLCTLPLDNMKTKIQRMVPKANGEMPYRGLWHCMRETIRFEGVSRLWVGFGPYFMRLFPHGMLILLIQEFIYEFIKA